MPEMIGCLVIDLIHITACVALASAGVISFIGMVFGMFFWSVMG